MKSKFGIGISLLLLFGSCGKDDNGTSQNSDFFPARVVNTSIDMNFAQYAALKNLQGYVYLTEGYRGIVVYHTNDDQYVAFDRTCPVNTDQACASVSVDSIAIRYRCGKPGSGGWEKCCNSVFDGSTGTPLSGEARRGLKQYYTAKSGTIIYISSSPI